MPDARYPAARSFAARLAAHFERLAADAAGAWPAAPRADAAAIEALIDAAFWASLQREEGFSPTISLALVPPERAGRPLRFATPWTLAPRALARLAPAVERPGIHLGVWGEQAPLRVWGMTRSIPSLCFVVEVLGPGRLVVKHRVSGDSGKFQNVAVFEGDEVKVLSPQALSVADHPALLRSLIAPESSGSPDDAGDVLLRLAVSMRAHQRGGTLLMVPTGSDAWRESIVRPIAYAVEPAFSELAELVSEAGRASRVPGTLARVVDAVAGLTAVDGATLITDRFELLAFGVKIGRPDGRQRVEQVLLSEPTEGDAALVMSPLQLGGTRHVSAAQFAQDQPNAVALVASQDGHFTTFAWSARAGMVHAHRVETLLV